MKLTSMSWLPAVGGIIGFSLVYAGGDGVNWLSASPKKFPPYSGKRHVNLTVLASQSGHRAAGPCANGEFGL